MRNRFGWKTRCELAWMSWIVRTIRVQKLESRGPLLISDVPEVGTDFPSVYQPNYRLAREKFFLHNPSCKWPRTQSRFRHIFLELQLAWSTRDWERARPYETDHLFHSHRFWIEEYKRHLINLGNAGIPGAVSPIMAPTSQAAGSTASVQRPACGPHRPANRAAANNPSKSSGDTVKCMAPS